MPRKKITKKKDELKPDIKFNSVFIQKFINNLMEKGKKSKSETIIYGMMEIIAAKTKEPDPMKVFKTAIANITPLVEIKSRRIGGATYQVPSEIKSERKDALAIRWLIKYADARKGKSMKEKLAEEVIEASNNQGNAVKKREDTHKMAEANKAFAHYKW